MSRDEQILEARFIGEVPEALLVQFTTVDALGAVVPKILTGYAVKFVIEDAAGVSLPAAGAAAIVDADQGQVSYSWAAADLDAEGWFTGQFWLFRAPEKPASRLFRWQVRRGTAAPAFP
jgi:hypothetical protein